MAAAPSAPPTAGRRSGVLLVGVVGGALALLGLAQTGPGESVLRSTGVSAAPDRFTELHFSDPAALAPIAKRPGGRIPVEFTIVNREGGLRRYEWTVSASGVTGGRGFQSGSVDVLRGRRIKARVQPSCTTRRTKVVVRIIRPVRRQIDYGLSCSLAAVSAARGRPVELTSPSRVRPSR